MPSIAFTYGVCKRNKVHAQRDTKILRCAPGLNIEATCE